MSASKRAGSSREAIDSSMSVVEMVMTRHEETIEQLMPIVGAVGAALGLEVLSQRAAMPKEQLAAMGAGVAYLASLHTTGPLRQLAMSVAAAGACYSAVELLRSHRPAAVYGEPATPVEPRQAAPVAVDAISRSDLARALGELSTRHSAEIESLRKSYVEMARELEAEHQAEVSGLRATIASLVDEREHAANTPATVTTTMAEPAPVEHSDLASNEAVDSDNATATRNDAASPPASSKIQDVLRLLTIAEIADLQGHLRRLPEEERAAMEAQLRPLPAEEVVAFLRNGLLSRSAA